MWTRQDSERLSDIRDSLFEIKMFVRKLKSEAATPKRLQQKDKKSRK